MAFIIFYFLRILGFNGCTFLVATSIFLANLTTREGTSVGFESHLIEVIEMITHNFPSYTTGRENVFN